MNGWTQYPTGFGWYKEVEGLILNAREDGAWSMYDQRAVMPSKCSTLAPILHPGLEGAMASAEQAANELITLNTNENG